MIAREEPFLKKRPLPRAPSRKDYVGENAGGEAASLREAPLPQTPSPEEWLGGELAFPPNYMPLLVGCGFLLLGCGHGG